MCYIVGVIIKHWLRFNTNFCFSHVKKNQLQNYMYISPNLHRKTLHKKRSIRENGLYLINYAWQQNEKENLNPSAHEHFYFNIFYCDYPVKKKSRPQPRITKKCPTYIPKTTGHPYCPSHSALWGKSQSTDRWL